MHVISHTILQEISGVAETFLMRTTPPFVFRLLNTGVTPKNHLLIANSNRCILCCANNSVQLCFDYCGHTVWKSLKYLILQHCERSELRLFSNFWMKKLKKWFLWQKYTVKSEDKRRETLKKLCTICAVPIDFLLFFRGHEALKSQVWF